MFSGKKLQGAALGEIIPSRRLLDFVHTIFSSEEPQELTLDLHGSQEKIFHFQGGLLKTPGATFPEGVILVIQDITQLTRLEQVRKDFVANVSHELKTPITSIKGYVENLIDAQEASEEIRRKFLERININADRLDNIIDDLLSLSKLEEKGAWQKEKEECSVQDLFDKVILNYEDRLKNNSMEVIITNKDDQVFLGYANLLVQALSNLISNAIKYATEGKRIDLGWRREREFIILLVKDYGPGVPLENPGKNI
jgi:two-component system phosphate regulon sensor histidine kinase PhoR